MLDWTLLPTGWIFAEQPMLLARSRTLSLLVILAIARIELLSFAGYEAGVERR